MGRDTGGGGSVGRGWGAFVLKFKISIYISTTYSQKAIFIQIYIIIRE
jgi:hypothetical protein